MSQELKKLEVFSDFEDIFPYGLHGLIFDFDQTVILNDSYQILYEEMSGSDGDELYQVFLSDLEKSESEDLTQEAKDIIFFEAYQKFKFSVLKLLRSKGRATEENVSKIIDKFLLREGFVELVRLAKELGIVVIIISAGIHIIKQFVEQKIPEVDAVYTNTQLIFRDHGQIYDFHQHEKFSEYKVEQLLLAAKQFGFLLSESIIFGDSGYDEGMIDTVQNAGGIGVAVATKNEKIRKIAKAEIQNFFEVVNYLQRYEEYAQSRGLLRKRQAS